MNTNGRYVRVRPRFKPRRQGSPADPDRDKRHKKSDRYLPPRSPPATASADDESGSDSESDEISSARTAPKPVQKLPKSQPTPSVTISPPIAIPHPPSSVNHTGSSSAGSHDSAGLLSPRASSSLDSISPKSEFGREMERLLELEEKSDDHPQEHFVDDISDVAKRTYRYGDIVTFDEDQEHEFKAVQIAKRPDENIADYCEKYINAFLNTSGGTMYFGIEDNGRIVGIPMNRAMRDNIRLRVDQNMSAYQPQVDPNLVKIEMIAVVYDPNTSSKKENRNRDRERDRDEKPNKQPLNRAEMVDSGTRFPLSDKRQKRRSRDGNRDRDRWFHKGASAVESSHGDSGDLNGEKAGTRYVIEVRVWKGLAPVYLTRNGTAYMRLSGSTQKMSADTIKERMEHGRPYRGGGVHSVPRDFIGRQTEIEEIRSYIAQEEAEQTKSRLSVRVVLWGMPLTGKSTLARRLVLEFSSRFPDLHIQIDLKGGYLSQSNYLEVSDAMVTVIKSVYPHKEIPEDRAQLKGLYESCFAQKRCILLIENVGTPEQIRDLTPSLATSVLVLVTSRKDLGMAAAELDAKMIRLTALNPDDAAQLLLSQCGSIVPRDQALVLAKLCGCMPLPIRILGNAISNKQMTPADMIANLQKDENRRALVDAPLQTAWEGYTEEMRTQLCQLSLFPTPFGLGGATAVLGVENRAAAQAILSQLCSFGLYELDAESRHYMQNDLLRLFVVDKAQSQPQLKEWMTRFVSYHLDVIEQVVLKADVAAALALFAKERAHIDAVQRYLIVIGNPQLTNAAATLARKFAAQLPRHERHLIDKYFVAAPIQGTVPSNTQNPSSDTMLVDDCAGKTSGSKSFVSAPPSPMNPETYTTSTATSQLGAKQPSSTILTGGYIAQTSTAPVPSVAVTPPSPAKSRKTDSSSSSDPMKMYGGGHSAASGH